MRLNITDGVNVDNIKHLYEKIERMLCAYHKDYYTQSISQKQIRMDEIRQIYEVLEILDGNLEERYEAIYNHAVHCALWKQYQKILWDNQNG